MRSSVPAFWECSCGRILLRGLSTQFGRKRYLLPVSRLLPAKLNRPLFRLCPKLLPSLPLPKAPGRKTQAIAIVLATTSMSFLNLPADHLRKSLPSGPMRFAVDRIRPGHMKSLGLHFRDEGQATRKSTRVRCEGSERGGDMGCSGGRLCDDLHTNLGHCPVLQRELALAASMKCAWEATMSCAVYSHFRDDKGLGVARVIALAFSLTLVGLSTVHAQDRAFQFGLIGDTGYSTEGIEGFKRLLASINAAELAFVVHVGDFENDGRAYTRNPSAGPMPCTDESFQAVYDSFQSIRHPVILTPGDNDWTDCHGVVARKFEPLERLAKVRTMFFPEGRSLGQRTIPVISQAADPQQGKFRENLRWSIGGVTFVTLHIVGSNDNFGRTPEMDAEHRERKAANIAWLRKAFSEAKASNSRGLALLAQANPGFENYWPAAQKDTYLRVLPGTRMPEKAEATGYDEYITVLAEEMESYTRPTVFLHGDTHRFRVDQPLFSAKDKRRFENFTRVETFGSPDTHWIRVTVDPADAQVFSFKAEIVAENVRTRR